MEDREFRELELTVTIDKISKEVYIGNENGSGAKYPFNHPSEIGIILNTYLRLYYKDFYLVE